MLLTRKGFRILQRSLFVVAIYFYVKFCFQELLRHGVHDVVRVCEPTYKTDELKKAGISVMDLVFDDGTFPPSEVSVEKE